MIEEPRHTEKEEPIPLSIVRAATSALVKEARFWLRWMGVGAVVGAGVLGGGGLYFFGLQGLALGVGIGAVLGGLLVAVLFLLASTGDIFG
jgi:hypothetical protein